MQLHNSFEKGLKQKKRKKTNAKMFLLVSASFLWYMIRPNVVFISKDLYKKQNQTGCQAMPERKEQEKMAQTAGRLQLN